jgi:HD-GYP domain-containing protein (c-di-GMP phosphodiesterase class II)
MLQLDTIRKKLGLLQLRSLSEYGDRISKFGVNFAVCDSDGEVVLLNSGGVYESSVEQLTELSRRVWREDNCAEAGGAAGAAVWRFGEENVVLASALTLGHDRNMPAKTAVGVVLIDLGVESADVRLGGGVNVDSAYWTEMLRLVVGNFHATTKADEQIEMVGTELAHTYEELVLLHKLSTNMRVTEHDANFLQMACDSLTEIIPVEGIAILLEKSVDNEQQMCVAAGWGLIDISEHTAAILHSRLVEEVGRGAEALLDSEVDSSFKYDWPENIRNIMAVPLFGMDKADSPLGEKIQDGTRVIGLMVAINRVEKQDFDSIDVKLFNSVANSCAVFIENGRLFGDIKELFIGSLKALTSSIDAKDPYTRGHSERVAFISRWIAERLGEVEPLTEEQIHKVYLTGLLHDIGKIGVDESVLRKKGKLTDEEFDCIKKHPSIGAGILRDIKQMRDIVPGVLCHHERLDGRGYPNGLVGDQMPLIGKIVGLADSFDAMTSKRIYRDAMTVDKALEQIREGLGTQFDEKVGLVFLNSDVHRLWEIMQGGPASVGTYEDDRFAAEYGAAAVGALIR